ncbi:NAD(P)-dependent dehydrogenase, short-chain alcohol dehydrogenase family [Sphingomonas sp. YR710]|uniref:SDR family NAD(P)-dependent oxidoreductase n=1 Tax=Sphingomonas sp. YR710 TaxID=1882773 RepID=UPI0008871585|nr:SDR family oxidoreductase [Sphingomonas sp. YR710]SDD75661.1 NAD(P)-dependent dehydrogenase, short-chain alcohol dehydrogenase family [Sphingomonas sp. YR710]
MTKHIFVTGSSRGIGRAIVERFKDDDVRVIGHRSSDGDENTIAGDLSDPSAARRLWDQALSLLDGRIDVLINNAGIFEAAALEAPDVAWSDSWTKTMQVNLTSAAELCRMAVLHYRKADGGRMINIASRAAYRGDSPSHWHYAASKAGMIGMTKTIARGYAAENILAFAICPGFTMTGMAEDYLESRGGDALLADIPLGRVALPEEIAEAARFLALSAPPSMTGSVIDINGASYVR